MNPSIIKPTSAWRRSMQLAPTMLVLALLAALAVVGHRSGWTLPKFSELLQSGAPATDDWCAEHAVPESICVECNPKQFPGPARYGWCAIHGVHDCLFEHPDI